MEILLKDMFRFDPDDIEKGKVKWRFLVPNSKGDDPGESYLLDPSTVTNGWALYMNKKKGTLKPGDVEIVAMRLEGDVWLLVAVKRILGQDPSNPELYLGEDVPEYSCYCGRMKLRWRNGTSGQNTVRWWSSVMDSVYVEELLPDEGYTGERFPGYEKTFISWKRLKSICDRDVPDWVAALRAVKAVYLITDERTGKLYVGSATSDDGLLLGRWRQYAETLHGGNVELRKLPPEKVMSDFRYSILQTFLPSVPDDEVLMYESLWKDRLVTRKTGYNRN